MRYNQVKQLKNKIEELKNVSDKSMAVTQELTILLVYMEAIKNLIKNDNSYVANTIQKAIKEFKSELISGFFNNHIITKLNKDNNLYNYDINDKTYEEEL